MMSTEFERIERLRRRFSGHAGDDRVVVGIGDDCAILAPSLRSQVLSVDAAVEGVHFDRQWLSLPEIGFRSFVVAMSDLAAMGAAPRAALTSLVLPRSLSDNDFDALAAGLAEASELTSAPIIGGNLAAGDAISIHTTVIGEGEGRALLRQGARPGDGVYITGVVGARALGLALLTRNSARERMTETERGFCRAWLRPAAQLQIGQRLAGYATSCIDVSDGLMQDLEHVCRASRVGARVFVESLPRAPEYERVCRATGCDPVELALTGGEDYELLFTAAVHPTVDELGTRIGEITAEVGKVVALDTGGTEVPLTRRGFQHFGA